MNRMVLFAKVKDSSVKDEHYYEDKVKESRRQLVPLAHVLDLPDNRTGDKIVGEALLDFRDVKEAKQQVYESDESRFSDCSLSDASESN